jgi:hypothetical protein
MSSSFSINKRRQVFALDMLEILLYSINKNGSNSNKELCKRIIEYRRHIVLKMFGTECFCTSKIRAKQYKRMIDAGIGEFERQFDLLGIRGTDVVWINVLIELTERTREYIPDKCIHINMLWDYICECLFEIYCSFDTEVNKKEEMELAHGVCNSLMQKMEDAL